MNSKQLQQIAEQMKKHQDLQTDSKIKDLIEKWNKGQMIVAFCGHFSAGKSTMINTLVGAEVLPSSPIPTSANLVLIGHGDATATAYKVDGSIEQFPLTDEGQHSLKTLCADGHTVTKVEISVPSSFLPTNVALMDTPGIDSTDDAHRLVTESTLHLADAVYYVVDYNHVQSELNFQFTKTLIDHGKRVWLIVNQIDKHFDLEMDFDSYRESTEDAFHTWGIQLEGIYYTSLIEPDHPENQFQLLQQNLQAQFQQSQDILEATIKQTVRGLIADHVHIVELQCQEETERCQDIIERSDFDTLDQVQAGMQVITSEIEQIVAYSNTIEQDVRAKINSLLANAPLTPYQTMERIERFLESRQTKFRVGFFGSQTKTEQEKTTRLQTLLDDVQEHAQSTIEWHLKQLLIETMKDNQIHSDDLMHSIQNIEVKFTPQDLVDLVNPGASLEGKYVHTYAKDLTAFIQSSFRRIAFEKMDEVIKSIQNVNTQKLAGLQEQKQNMETVVEAYQLQALLADQTHKYEQELISILESEV